MKCLLAAIVCIITHSPASDDHTQSPATTRGKLIAVGGGTIDDNMARRIIDAAGGPDANFLIIPCASKRPEAGEESAKAWRERGAKNVNWLSCTPEESKPLPDADGANGRLRQFEGAVPLTRPITADESSVNSTRYDVDAVRSADFIWFSGGDQNRLMVMLNEFKLADVIRERHAAGAAVGGTSAGAAVLSRMMLTGQSDLDRIATRPGDTAQGLGLWPDVIVDQHFLARQRFNRLLAAVLEHPNVVGVGIDESTGVIVSGARLEVFGNGQVLIIDARGTALSRSTHTTEPGQVGRGAALHVLGGGSHWHPTK